MRALQRTELTLLSGFLILISESAYLQLALICFDLTRD